jgi:hypothetical protein
MEVLALDALRDGKKLLRLVSFEFMKFQSQRDSLLKSILGIFNRDSLRFGN